MIKNESTINKGDRKLQSFNQSVHYIIFPN